MVDFNIEDFASPFGIDINAERISRKVIELCKNSPGFFTPFQDGRDVGISFAAPAVASLGLGTITALLAAASVIAGAVCLASLITAGITAAASKTDARNTSLTVAAISGIISVVAPFIAAIAAILTVVASAVALSYVLTRTGATIVSALHSCFSCAKEEDSELEDDQSVGPIPMTA